MVILPKEYEGTEDLTWIWIFHFQEADLQYTPWPTVSLSSLSSLPSIQILKTLSPSQPSLQSTSCNKAQIRRLPMFAFCLVYFCVSSEHIHPSQQCLGSELWWAGVWVDRILPKGASHITLDWWWQWWRWCCWWWQWRLLCWWLSAINCILWSQCPVRVKTKSQIKTSDYLNLYEIDFTLGPIQISRCIVFWSLFQFCPFQTQTLQSMTPRLCL